jgi:hypothetical protein
MKLLEGGKVEIKKKTRDVELSGEFEGLKLKLWINIPVRLFGEFQELSEMEVGFSQMEKLCEVLSQIILEWNLDGAPSKGSLMELPVDLLTAITKEFTTEIGAVPNTASAIS